MFSLLFLSLSLSNYKEPLVSCMSALDKHYPRKQSKVSKLPSLTTIPILQSNKELLLDHTNLRIAKISAIFP